MSWEHIVEHFEIGLMVAAPILLMAAVLKGCYWMMDRNSKSQKKVEPYKDERTPLDQLRAEILESLKRGEWEFELSGTCTTPRLSNTMRNCAMIVYNKNVSAWEWNGVTLCYEAVKLIQKKSRDDFAHARVIEWRNAQPIKKDVDNAPKA